MSRIVRPRRWRTGRAGFCFENVCPIVETSLFFRNPRLQEKYRDPFFDYVCAPGAHPRRGVMLAFFSCAHARFTFFRRALSLSSFFFTREKTFFRKSLALGFAGAA
jgi:hypothetical protein